MKFETKMSGTMVTEFEITPILTEPILFLHQAMNMDLKQKTMNYILDNFRFYKNEVGKVNEWYALLDMDSIVKISIMERYPNYEQELIDKFGERWAEHYLRFGH